MSGHSKWHSIKHKKAAADSKRGKIFTRYIKEIAVAARMGGGDLDSNARLRTAVAAAKAVNMPADNITRAIQRGTGELPGVNYEEMTYEGYGPGGVAVMVEIMTDNKNRTVSEIRHMFSKHGGNLGENGCVAWMFKPKGQVVINDEKANEDDLLLLVMDLGAENIEQDESYFTIMTPVEALEPVRKAVEEAGYNIEEANLTMITTTPMEITDEKRASQVLRLMEALEEHDDVQKVHSNFDIPEDVMAALEE